MATGRPPRDSLICQSHEKNIESMSHVNLRIIPFESTWQDQARLLVLTGLEEHWGKLAPSMNRDLEDIERHYASGRFLIALCREQIVGTGAIVPEGTDIMRLVRMSVAKSHRRMGVATRLLASLLQWAQDEGCRNVVCETTDTWADAIGFYLHHGFAIAERRDGEVHFVRHLRP